MAVALWIVGGFVVVVYFGTLALQLALWALEVMVRLTILASCAMLGAAALLFVGGQRLWAELKPAMQAWSSGRSASAPEPRPAGAPARPAP